MEKARKLNEAIQLLNIVYNSLHEIGTACENERKLIFKALEVEDAEQVEDAKLYGIVLDLDYNSQDLIDKAEELKRFIDSLERVKL